MREAEIKRALAQHLDGAHGDVSTLLLEELKLSNGEIRADVVDVHDMHCYEIKSEGDSLKRLLGQGSRYARVFDHVTLVTTERHLKKAMPILPQWWGHDLLRSMKRRGSSRCVQPSLTSGRRQRF